MLASDGEKQKTLDVIESFGLKPISIQDAFGIEQNALTHTTAISKLPTGPIKSSPVVPHKRKLDEHETCSRCSFLHYHNHNNHFYLLALNSNDHPLHQPPCQANQSAGIYPSRRKHAYTGRPRGPQGTWVKTSEMKVAEVRFSVL